MPKKKPPTAEISRREVEAIKIIRGKSDVKEGSRVVFGHDFDRNRIEVNYKLWNDRDAHDVVGFDSDGFFLIGSSGEIWVLQPDARRPDGRLVKSAGRTHWR